MGETVYKTIIHATCACPRRRATACRPSSMTSRRRAARPISSSPPNSSSASGRRKAADGAARSGTRTRNTRHDDRRLPRRGASAAASAPCSAMRPAQETQGQRGNGARLIAIDLLNPNPFQPRRQFDETDLRELTESVRANGILQPIVVRPRSARAGPLPDRRRRAALAVGPARQAARGAGRCATTSPTIRAWKSPSSKTSSGGSQLDRGGARLSGANRPLQLHPGQARRECRQKPQPHPPTRCARCSRPPEARRLVEDGKLTGRHARALITAKDLVALAREGRPRPVGARDGGAGDPLRADAREGGRKGARARTSIRFVWRKTRAPRPAAG